MTKILFYILHGLTHILVRNFGTHTDIQIMVHIYPHSYIQNKHTYIYSYLLNYNCKNSSHRGLADRGREHVFWSWQEMTIEIVTSIVVQRLISSVIRPKRPKACMQIWVTCQSWSLISNWQA